MLKHGRVAAAGAALLSAGGLTLAVLPRLSPFKVLHCVPPGETVCFSGVNPAYPAAFLLCVAGTVALFFGAFGRRFVASPLFVAGMIALSYGLSGVVSASLDTEKATPAAPEVFMPLLVIGALALWLQTYRTLRRKRA